MSPKHVIRREVLAFKAAILRLDGVVAALIFLWNKRRPRPGLTVLCYHRTAAGVPKRAPFDPYNVEPGLFGEQIAAIKSVPALKLVSAADVTRWLETRIPDEGSYVLLTFDDVWAHTLNAAEMLAQKDCSAVFFVPTGYVESSVYSFSRFDSWCSSRPDANVEWYRPIDMEGCARLRRLGMEVQPHSHMHESLGHLAQVQMQRDVDRSLDFCRDRLGVDVVSFCYPFGNSKLGDVNDSVVDFLNRRGVRIAFTTDDGSNSLDRIKSDRLRLKRVIVRDQDRSLVIQAKASGYSGFFSVLRGWVHGAIGSA